MASGDWSVDCNGVTHLGAVHTRHQPIEQGNQWI
jgi:hypothetical protein